MNMYNISYQQQIRSCFRQAYDFFDTHKHVRTKKDWENIARSLGKFDDENIFTRNLIVVVVKELERESEKEQQKNTRF